MAGEIIGKVQSVQGVVEVRMANGRLRALTVGDELHEGETVLTTGGGKLVIQLADGGTVAIGRGVAVAMTPDLSTAHFAGADEAQVANVDQVVQAVLGKGDLVKLLDPTAAGLVPGNEGHTFVQLLRVVETVDAGGSGSTSSLASDTGLGIGRITPLVNAPDAIDDSATTDEETPVTIAVLDNDSDPEGDPLTIIEFTQGAHGTVVIDPESGNPVYTPEANFTGTDTFTYTISDGHGGTDTATVTVTVNPVNDLPDAVDDAVTTNEDTPKIGRAHV
jgi:hypothetical protein